jgi:hypothetical protein
LPGDGKIEIKFRFLHRLTTGGKTVH